MKIGLVCHGNIARSQILHHYLVQYAAEAGWALEVFSCGTAPEEAYPNAAELLDQVQHELDRRGVHGRVTRNVLDRPALDELRKAQRVLVADRAIRDDIQQAFTHKEEREKVWLFYECIGEGAKDFVDTYDPQNHAQDPARFSACFDELERIASRIVEQARMQGSPWHRLLPKS